jgi:hypothetical protein
VSLWLDQVAPVFTSFEVTVAPATMAFELSAIVPATALEVPL